MQRLIGILTLALLTYAGVILWKIDRSMDQTEHDYKKTIDALGKLRDEGLS